MSKSKSKQLSINLVANIISYSSTIIVAFFLTPYLVEELGKEAYSYYPLANNFVQYMSIITVALNSMASRFITIEITKKNMNKANIYFSSIFYSNLILSLVISIPMILIIIFLDTIINIPVDLIFSVKVLFSLVFVSMIINIITSVFSVAVFAKNRIDLRSIGEIIQAILKVLLYLAFFSFFTPSIIYVGVISLILNFTYLFIHSIYTRYLLPDIKISIAYFNITAIKEVLFSGVWNSVNQIGNSLLFSLAILYCNVFVGVSAGGEYSIIQTVPNFINGIISMLTAVFMPIIMQTYAVGTKADLIYEVRKSQKIMGMITNIPIAIFIAVGVEFFTLWVPGENAYRLQTLSILTIFHLLIIGVTWTVSNLNIVLNKVKIPAIYMIISGILNFILVYFLTSSTDLGVYAVPLSSFLILLCWAAFFIPLYPCFILRIKKTTFYPVVIKTLLSAVLIFLITITVKKIIIIHSWISLLLVCIVSGILGIIINFIIIFNLSEKKYIIRLILRYQPKAKVEK